MQPLAPTTLAPTIADDTTSDTTSPHDRKIIGVLLVAAFIVILNETIMNVAVPKLMEELRITASVAQWLSTGFMLTMAVIIPTTGFLIQKFTTRTLFVAAMTLFCLGTFVSGLAPGFGVLLVGRVLQACGTGLMMPLLMTVILKLIPPPPSWGRDGNCRDCYRRRSSYWADYFRIDYQFLLLAFSLLFSAAHCLRCAALWV